LEFGRLNGDGGGEVFERIKLCLVAGVAKAADCRSERLRAINFLSVGMTSRSGFLHAGECTAPAGQTVPHVHVHAIPRYSGDMPTPEAAVGT